MSNEEAGRRTGSETAGTEPVTSGIEAVVSRRAERKVVLIVQHPRGAEIALLAPNTPVSIGRTAPSSLRIDERTLSREHARLVLSGGRVHVEDLGSRNGIFVAGRRVERAELDIGEDVVLGNVVARVEALSPSGESLGVESEERFRRRVDEELARARQFQRPFALLLVRSIPAGVGVKAASEGPERSWIEAVRSRIRPVDRIALYGSDAAQVLLPETRADEAARIVGVIAAPLPSTEVRLVVGLAMYPDTARGVHELIERSRDAAYRATAAKPVVAAPPSGGLVEEGEAAEGALIAGSAMRALIDTVERVAGSRLPIVLHGETGTGKEVLARLIHERGPRGARRMVSVNCAVIPKDLVESTLFGHERGAFTGAMQQHKGIFEEADSGTVFLDEIGELPLAVQAALLRVLEVGAFNRVGSSREIKVDVRIIAATHRDLQVMVESGTFRADLYYRLSGFVIEIPPLRERTDELEPFARRFLQMANKANGRSVEGFEPEALELLKAYRWPGNVRELRNAIERAVVVTSGPLIRPPDLPASMRAWAGQDRPPAASSALRAPAETEPVRGAVQQYEAKLVRDALEATGWSRAEAASRLGIPVRTLSYRMKILGIKPARP
ncbi:sigma 54-interacting transcriptional regulator [Sorangium sp. So ce1000]|uniref:sigma 54-interacting transcriptional regulator n=1 Tax=Sorangium sp. So ce1000 TaxID=3133325 RepID=UPI003F5F2B56